MRESPVPAQRWDGGSAQSVEAQMREEKSPVPVLMWAGKAPIVANLSDRGEGCGWVESREQMRMSMSAAQSNAVARGDRARAMGGGGGGG
jgi:hypothetical protein